MTFEEFDNTLCGLCETPVMHRERKGRRRVMLAAIEVCPPDGNLRSIGGRDGAIKAVLRQRTRKAMEDRYGLGWIAIAVLSGLISAVVKALFEWWLNSREEASAAIVAMKAGPAAQVE